MKPQHYTNPFLQWVFNFKGSSFVDIIYHYTGLNFRDMEDFDDEFLKFMMMVMGWYVLYAVVFIAFHTAGANLLYVFVGFMLVTRILIAPLNFKWGSAYTNDGYMDKLIEYEAETFGRQVTPSWFLYVWYGILRVGQWKSINFVLGTITQLLTLVGLTYMFRDLPNDIIGTVVGVPIAMYYAFVYRNEIAVL